MTSSLLQQLLSLAAMIASGTALGVILRYRTKMRELTLSHGSAAHEAKRMDFETILAEVRTQRDAERATVEALSARCSQMENEIQGLRLAHDLDPFPNWISDRNGEYLYVNREFEKAFLEPQGESYRNIIGKKRTEIWPEDFCKTLAALDLASRSRPDGTARAITSLDVPTIGPSRVTVHKFPIRFKPAGVIVAYQGFITAVEPHDELIGHQAA